MAGILILLVLAGIAAGKYPGLRMNRATIAMVGAAALIGTGIVSLEEAYRSVDLDTILLLFAMMIINVNLRLAGFFRLVGGWVIRFARSPRTLLALVIGAAGLLSALFLNDTIVLMLTPLVIEIVLSRRRDPVPYLIGLAASANIGSAATITGNPQNMLIGISSGIPYLSFTARLAVPSLAGLAVSWLVIMLLFRKEFRAGRFEGAGADGLPPAPMPVRIRVYRPLLYKSLVSVVLMLTGFIGGVPIPLAALAAASILLFTRRLRPERVFREVDFSLLVFFAGLFVVTGAIGSTGIADRLFRLLGPALTGGIASLSIVSAVLSNIVSNVPAVMLFRPFVPSLPDPQSAWLVLAMATTFAGNLTLLGSVANLIVAESAKRYRVDLSFGAYLAAGLPITVITIAIGAFWLIVTG